MSVSEGVRHYTSHQDYLQRAKKPEMKPQANSETITPDTKPPEAPAADTVVELSEEATSQKPQVSKDLSNQLKKAAKLPGTPQIPLMAMDAIKDIKPPDWAQEPEELEGPGMYFISGLKLFSASKGDGIEEMAKHLEGAQHFSWVHEKEILQDIMKRPIEEPIVLVGHSLGGNAAVKIANQLNSPAFGFRQIDLMVTMDSFGLGNDVIPANVKKNLNFIGHRNVFFNDGPNIARDSERTQVLNELRDEFHTQIDNAPDIQEKIYRKIAGAVAEARVEMLSQLDLIPSGAETIIVEFDV
jgi:hypothetical protein